jgi:hypothetical protein
MKAELGFLTYLVRSSSVWGVCSQVSGPFRYDDFEALIKTCDRIEAFLVAKPFNFVAPTDEGVHGVNTGISLLANRFANIATSTASSFQQQDNPIYASPDATRKVITPFYHFYSRFFYLFCSFLFFQIF